MGAVAMTPDSRITYRVVLANPSFRVLLATRVLASVADTLRTVALAVLVFVLTGSPLLGALAYGIVHPAARRRKPLGGTRRPDGAKAVDRDRLHDRVRDGSAARVGGVPVWPSLSVVGLVASVTPVLSGASGRAVADVLADESYVVGRSLFTVALSASQLIGLVGGGVAVAGLGAQHAMLVAAGLHLIAAAWVRLRLSDLPVGVGAHERGTRAAVRQSWTGNRRILAEPTTRALILAQWLPPAFVTGAESLMVPYVSARGLPAGSAGLLLACLPMGMLIGGLVVGRILSGKLRERLVVASMALVGLPLLGFAAGDPPVWLCAFQLLLAGLGLSYGLAIQRRFRDVVPQASRGRPSACSPPA